MIPGLIKTDLKSYLLNVFEYYVFQLEKLIFLSIYEKDVKATLYSQRVEIGSK